MAFTLYKDNQMNIKELPGTTLLEISYYLSNKELCCLVRTSKKIHSRLIRLNDVRKRFDKKCVVEELMNRFSEFKNFNQGLVNAKNKILCLQKNDSHYNFKNISIGSIMIGYS